MKTNDDGSDGVLPAWIRYPLVVLLGGIGMVAVIVALYDRGFLPLVGPFVAVVVGAMIVFFVMWWRNRRLHRLSGALTHQLQGLAASIAREGRLPATERPTGASDQSLSVAAGRVDLALQQLAWGHEQGATPLVADLAAETTPEWDPAAPLTQDVVLAAQIAAEAEAMIQKMVEAAERRRR